MLRAILSILCCLAFTGCEHTRSFLQMNSDAPTPFLGLQLAVDRETPAVTLPVNSAGRKSFPAGPAAGQPEADQGAQVSDHEKPEFLLASQSVHQRDGRFSFTGDQSVRQGDVRMALPKVEQTAGSAEAAEVKDLLNRLKRL